MIFWPSQVKSVHKGFHGPMRRNLDLNERRHDIVRPEILFSKQLDAMIHVYITSQKMYSKIFYVF